VSLVAHGKFRHTTRQGSLLLVLGRMAVPASCSARRLMASPGPPSSRWRDWYQPLAGSMSVSKQVFWLRDHPSIPPWKPLKLAFGRPFGLGTVVTRHSGETTRDFHPVPYSPPTLSWRHLQTETHN